MESQIDGPLAMDIIQTWKNSPEIQAEFCGDFGAYAAYREGVANGRIKICVPGNVTGKIQ